MNEHAVNRQALLSQLPPERCDDLLPAIREMRDRIGRKVIVLDDDPTGTQTVYDIPVVTKWSVKHMCRELQDAAPASYVLTNSRSMAEPAAVALNREIATNLREASRLTGRDFAVISRSDSTLRGHYPAEIDVLEQTLGLPFDACVLCPFFLEGGRLTVNNVHYVAEGEQLVPAALTPFASDAAFGYRSSNLRDWVVEKSRGRIAAEQIVSLSIDELRSPEIDSLPDRLRSLTAGTVCLVNAASNSDMRAATWALMRAEASGKRFLYRTAASFVAARAGIEPRALLAGDDLKSQQGRGVLFVIGSYVPKTTAQLNTLLPHLGDHRYELNVTLLLDAHRRDNHIQDVAERVSNDLANDRAVAVFTSRELVSREGEASLDIGRQVSRALVAVVAALHQRPRLLIAKGGITSSDIATDACKVERAMVMGQILPGVPVWRCGPDSRFPGLPLVVFPGNVGSDQSLVEVLKKS
jgi:uncharacterized protein YgbK (DUF1537 family)